MPCWRRGRTSPRRSGRAGVGRGLAPGAAIAALRDTDPEGWGVLTAVVPGAYFLNPAIRAAIGYPGLEARPIDPDAAPDYLAGRAARLGDRARTRVSAHPLIDCRPCRP